MTLAAGVAVLVTVVRRGTGDRTAPHVDSLLVLADARLRQPLRGQPRGSIAGGGHGIAWAQGVRLVVRAADPARSPA